MSSLLPHQWLATARRRAAIEVTIVWAPLVLVLAAIALRVGTVGLSAGVLIVGVIALGLVAAHHARRFDRDWLVRRLNARETQLEHSAELLFAGDDLAPLARLQAARIASRIEAVDPATLSATIAGLASGKRRP